MPTTTFRFREFRFPDDLAGMTAIRNVRVRRAQFGEFTDETLMRENYAHLTNCDVERDIVVAVDDDGRIVGYARTMWDDTAEGTRDHWLVVEPDPTCDGLEDLLLDWCTTRALAVAATMDHPQRQLVTEALQGSDREELLLRRGFSAVRYGASMTRALTDVPERALPDGVEIRPASVEHLRQVWDAENEAFRDHWGFVEPTEEDWERHRASAELLDLSLWQVAWSGADVAGQVRTYAHPEEEELFGVRRAWTEHISTARAWRRRGVASALICASLRQLAERGYEQAALGVDTENPNSALRLYSGLGYEVVAMEVRYALPIST